MNENEIYNPEDDYFVDDDGNNANDGDQYNESGGEDDVDLENDEYSVNDIEHLINAGVMHTHELRPIDKPKRPGVHWKLFHAIYMTEGQKLVPRFYYCPMCHDLFYIKKGNGTNTLTRSVKPSMLQSSPCRIKKRGRSRKKSLSQYY